MEKVTACFHIVEESITKDFPSGSTLLAWERLNKKFQKMKGASKTILRNKFAKSESGGVTRDPKDWFNELELLRVDKKKLEFLLMIFKL